MNNQVNFVKMALEDILCNPLFDENKISQYFAAEYQQYVDGKTLNYNEFSEHLRYLKNNTQHVEVSFFSIISHENTVFSHHYVTAEKNDGGKSEFEILARFTLSLGKIICCHELTRMVNGNKADYDLGSKQ